MSVKNYIIHVRWRRARVLLFTVIDIVHVRWGSSTPLVFAVSDILNVRWEQIGGRPDLVL